MSGIEGVGEIFAGILSTRKGRMDGIWMETSQVEEPLQLVVASQCRLSDLDDSTGPALHLKAKIDSKSVECHGNPLRSISASL